METKELKKAYESVKTDVANLLGWFECELQKQPANLNWAHVGSLSHVRTNLIETLSFISGIEQDMIKDGLAEAWADAEIKKENQAQEG
jgi:hypothetical protein